MEEDEDEEDEGEEEEDVVEDRDYYYDSYKVDDYNEESPTEPSNDKAAPEKEVSSDMKCKRCSRLQVSGFPESHLLGARFLIKSLNATWRLYLSDKLANRGEADDAYVSGVEINSPEHGPYVCR